MIIEPQKIGVQGEEMRATLHCLPPAFPKKEVSVEYEMLQPRKNDIPWELSQCEYLSCFFS